MKTVVVTMLMLLCMLLIPSVLTPQYMPTNGPNGGTSAVRSAGAEAVAARAHWVPHKGLTKADFSTKAAFSPVSHISVIDTALSRRLADTTRERFTYNSMGKITSTKREQWIGNAWILLTRDTTIFDDRGNLLFYIFDYMDGDFVRSRYRVTYTYTDSGGVYSRAEVLQFQSGDSWTDYYRYTLNSDEQGHLLSWTFESPGNNGWRDDKRGRIIYDGNWNPLFQITERIQYSQWIRDSRYASTFDSSGHMLSEVFETASGCFWIPLTRRLFAYDETGTRISEITAQMADCEWVNGTRYTYTYDANGNLLSSLAEGWDNDRWEPMSRYIYTYDESGRLLTITYEMGLRGLWGIDWRKTFTYDRRGDLVKFVNRMWYLSGWAKSDGDFTTTDSAGNTFYFYGYDVTLKRHVMETGGALVTGSAPLANEALQNFTGSYLQAVAIPDDLPQELPIDPFARALLKSKGSDPVNRIADNPGAKPMLHDATESPVMAGLSLPSLQGPGRSPQPVDSVFEAMVQALGLGTRNGPAHSTPVNPLAINGLTPDPLLNHNNLSATGARMPNTMMPLWNGVTRTAVLDTGISVIDTATVFGRSAHGGQSWARYVYSFSAAGKFTSEAKFLWDAGVWFKSSRLLYTYDSKGRILTSVRQYGMDNEWVNSNRTIFAYDERDNVISQMYEAWVKTEWVKSSLMTSTYDDRSNLLSVLYESWSKGELMYSYRYTYTYDDRSNLLSELSESLTEGQWKGSSRTTYTYDDRSNRLSALYEYSSNGQWVGSTRYTYTYDDRSNVLSTVIEYWSTDQWVNSMRTSSTYDSEDRRLTYVYENWADGRWVRSGRDRFTYDVYGNLQSTSSETWTGCEWSIQWRVTFTYDAHGHTLSQMSEGMRDCELTKFSLSSYTYDGRGMRLSEVLQYWTNNQWITQYRGDYRYDARGELIGYSSSTPPDGIISIEISDSLGNHYYYSGYEIALKRKIIVPVSEAPMITLQHPAAGRIFQTGDTCMVRWECIGAIDSVSISYSLDNGRTYIPVRTLCGKTEHAWVIPAITDYTIGARIKLTGYSGSRIISDSCRSPFTLVGRSVSSPMQVGWNFWSMPLTAPDQSVKGVLGASLPDSIYYAFSFNRSGSYVPAERIDCGTGYWLALSREATATLGGKIAPDSTVQQLYAGMNMIGMPLVAHFPKNRLSIISGGSVVSFDTAVSRGLINNLIVGYAQAGGNDIVGSYITVDTLQPLKAYWVSTDKEGVGILFRSANLTAQAHTQPVAEGIEPVDSTAGKSWRLSLETSIRGAKDLLAQIGIDQMATAGFDSRFDLPAPPPVPGKQYVQLVMSHPEWNKPWNVYARDIRGIASSNSWILSVICPSDYHDTIMIRWNRVYIDSVLLPAERLSLQAGDQRVDMRRVDHFSFLYNNQSITINGTMTGVADTSKYPIAYALRGNYPNPFNSGTTIEYDIPAISQVKVVVYNVLGQLLASLTDAVQPAGTHRAVWQPAVYPSGTYFYRIEAVSIDDPSRNFTQVRKMILAK